MRFLELHEIQIDSNWVKLKDDSSPYESEKHNYLFAYNFEDDLCEVLFGHWNPNSYGNGTYPRAMWVCGTIDSQEEFLMDDMTAWTDISYVTAYFAIKKGTGRVGDFLRINEMYYSHPDFCDKEGDAIYEINLMKYYHILPYEITNMTKNGFVEIFGLDASEASFTKLFDKLDI